MRKLLFISNDRKIPLTKAFDDIQNQETQDYKEESDADKYSVSFNNQDKRFFLRL